jgi:hypothetical protein
MSYSGLIEDLVQPILYGALTVLAFVQWRRHPGPAGAWLAVAFGVLGVVLVAGLVLPESSTSPAAEWAGKALIAILALFPYSLYRFVGSLVRRVRWVRIVALVLTIAVPEYSEDLFVEVNATVFLHDG